jgi:hypothetical protein
VFHVLPPALAAQRLFSAAEESFVSLSAKHASPALPIMVLLATSEFGVVQVETLQKPEVMNPSEGKLPAKAWENANTFRKI